MYGGKCFIFIRMYYGISIGEAKKKSLRLHDMNRDPLFASEMVLFKINLFSIREAAGDTGSF